MCAISTTNLTGATFGNTGTMNRWRPLAGTGVTPRFVTMTLPTGVNITATRPSAVTYRNRKYFAGLATDNLLVDEFFRVSRVGIKAPTEVPTLAAAAGPGATGSAIVCFDFWDEKTNEASPLSAPSAAVTLANQKRTTGNLPTSSQDARVSHVRVWVSMDGAAFRLSTKRRIGVTSITEGVATLALGVAADTTFTRLPRGTINAIYHERQFVAGVFSNPDTLYCSALLKPERWESLTFRTRNGEPIIALIPARDTLLVGTPTTWYGLRGYTEEDMVLTLIAADIGAIGHAQNALVGEDAIIPSHKGIYLYNGAFHNIIKDQHDQWEFLFEEYQTLFEKAFGIYDSNESVYQLVITGLDQGPAPLQDFQIPDPASVRPSTVMWVADLSSVIPEEGGGYGQPDWSFDVMDRTVESAGYLALPGGKRGNVYFGFCDGIVRVKDPADDDDDGDEYNKRIWIRTKHYDMGDPGGDESEGKEFNRWWSYVRSEGTDWVLYLKAGDEEAWRNLAPDNALFWWMDSVALSAATQIISGDTYTLTPVSRHPHMPRRVTGHGVTAEYTANAPLNFFWNGFGGAWGPGRASRGSTAVGGGG